MKNRIYLEALTEEENNKIELIRKFVGVDSYESLSFIFNKIEQGLQLTEREKIHLDTYYGYEVETTATKEIREYINLYYRIYQNTLKFSLIELDNALSDVIENVINDIRWIKRGIAEKWNNLKKKILG